MSFEKPGEDIEIDEKSKAQLERVQKKDPAQSKDLMIEKLMATEEYQEKRLKVHEAIKAGVLPSGTTFEKGMLITRFAEELGVSPLVALSNFFIVDGRLGMSAAYSKARVHEKLPECLFKVIESTPEKCVIVTKRNKDDPNEPQATWIYTREEAKAFDTGSKGLKDNWKKFPTDMLRNRCITRAIRGEFSDVFLGAVYDPEELHDPIDEKHDAELKELNNRYLERGKGVQVPHIVNEDHHGSGHDQNETHNH